MGPVDTAGSVLLGAERACRCPRIRYTSSQIPFDVGAQSDLISAPRLVIAEEPPTAASAAWLGVLGVFMPFAVSSRSAVGSRLPSEEGEGR
jgi:hypothetical protein